MTDAPVPRLDLAPKLNRPLRLWWPPDYLRLLYWAFFFPQAIRWYVWQIGKPARGTGDNDRVVWKVVRNNPVLTKLVIQASLSHVLVVLTILLLLQAIGLPIGWADLWAGRSFTVAGGILLGAFLGAVTGVIFSAIDDVVVGVTVSLVGTVAGCMAFGGIILAYTQTGWGNSVPVLIFPGAMVGLAAGIVFGAVSSTRRFIAAGVSDEIVLDLMFGLANSVALGIAAGVGLFLIAVLPTGTPFDMQVIWDGPAVLAGSVGIAFLLSAIMLLIRLPDWLLVWLLTRTGLARTAVSHVTWLPLKTIQSLLEISLKQDWETGIHNVNQILTYTMQFIPVIQAVEAALEHTHKDESLDRVVRLVDLGLLWDRRLLRFGSASLNDYLSQKAVDGIWWLPKSWRQRWQSKHSSDLRADTPIRAACAGFMLWYEGKAEQAADAFKLIQGLRHGPELYGIAQAIAVAHQTIAASQQAVAVRQRVDDLDDLTKWAEITTWLDTLTAPELRPGTLEILRPLRRVACEARVAQRALAPLYRVAALSRATAILTKIIESGGTSCPYPEWPLIAWIVRTWRDVVGRAGGIAGTEISRQTMLNPYEGYSGLPVTGPTFVGRNDILRQIETRWAVSDRLPPLILYGHRRMGKSSIVRNLGRGTDSSMILVYLDMQDAGWVDHTGQLLLDFAEAIYRKASEAVLDAGPAPVEGDYADLGVARRALNSLLDRLDGQMADRRLILAVDEFEIIQQGIEKGRIDPDLLHYLRSKASQYRWLALIFAGLHTLDEMGHDYRSAFYGAAEHVRVGYLSHDDALQLITQPHPDFSLEYAPELREELFHLTYGQPYLLQRLCWELVNRWNERFLRGGEATLRELTMDDLAPILTPDFYEAAGYYFDGVWSNVTEAERGLMRALAIFGSVGDRPEQPGGGWTAEGLVAATGQTPEAVSVALDLLRRHDVIVEEAGGVRFASELMRRWVAQYQ